MIDAVITWVDGSDPVLSAKRRRYTMADELVLEDVAGATRYADLGEIHWCVRSINKFAPWIHKIYIITDGQDPKVESRIPVEIVDHKIVFSGYEQYLPTFNSLSIESMMWRIPGLSERFIYFNDDIFLIRPCLEEDFFIGDKPVCYGCRGPLLWFKLLVALKKTDHGRKQVTVKSTLLRSAAVNGNIFTLLYLDHTPRSLLKSSLDRFYATHPEALIQNISHRFRDREQHRVDAVAYMTGGYVRRPYKKFLVYMEPKDKPDYLKKKLMLLDIPYKKFCCINSLDKASPDDRRMVVDRIDDILKD